jgi:hypothetical protein
MDRNAIPEMWYKDHNKAINMILDDARPIQRSI